MSQEKFARLVGLSYNTYRGWLYNNRLPDAGTACDMAQILGVTVEYLVWGKYKTKAFKEQKSSSDKIKRLVLKLSEETKRLN